MFRKLMDRFNRFMYGRYGADNLFYTLIIAYFVLGFLNMLFGSYILFALECAALVYALFRCFSKNIYKRRDENRKFLAAFAKFKSFFILTKDRIKDIKTARYRKCKYCKSILRLPVRHGKHSVKCPRCQRSFDVHIWF